jgi:hypothetical protein
MLERIGVNALEEPAPSSDDVVDDAVVRVHRRQPHAAVLGQSRHGEQGLVGVVAHVAAEGLQRARIVGDVERRR